MKKQHIKYIKFFFLIFGIALFILLIIKSDPQAIYLKLKSVHTEYFIAVIFYAFVWRYLHAFAFYILCGLKDTKQGVFVMVQILSNTISDIYPVGNAGGEIYRIYKMSEYYPQHKRIFFGRTILYNTFYAFAMLLVFFTSGFYLTLIWDLPSVIEYIFLTIMIFLGILTFVLIFLQSRGMLATLLKIFLKIPSHKVQNFIGLVIKKVEPIDESMRGFYSRHPVRAWVFIFLMYLSRMLTIGEVMLIGFALGVDLAFSKAVLINMVDGFIRIAFFIVPNGQIGVLEAAIASLGRFIGESTTTMLSFSVLQRARSIIWDGIGVGIMIVEKIKRK